MSKPKVKKEKSNFSQIRNKIITAVNKKVWWRTVLPDLEELHRRGLFLASTYKDAEFYGRPLNEPFFVTIKNPYITSTNRLDIDVLGKVCDESIEQRFEFDELIKTELISQGYDSVLLVSDKAYDKLINTGKLPRSSELNIFSPEQLNELNN